MHTGEECSESIAAGLSTSWKEKQGLTGHLSPSSSIPHGIPDGSVKPVESLPP